MNVPIKGVEQLYLVVSDAGNGYSCDWADWAEPTLVGPNGNQSLTELQWTAAHSQYGSVQKNKNCRGQTLKIGGHEFPVGLGTHANSVIAYQLPKDHQFERFQALGGLDEGGVLQPGGGATSVQFLVYDQAPPEDITLAAKGANVEKSTGHDLDSALNQLDVADGLEVQLFAGEPQMLNPTNIDIDHRGRVWVCEVVNYRQFRNKDSAERTEGDRILILSDDNGDGEADTVKTFYQGRDIDSAHGILVLGNRVLVSAGDSVFWLIDENGDDKADRKETLFTGISGTQHDHGIHAAVFGPDGKLYFNFGNAGGQIKDKHGNPITDKQGNVVDSSRKPYQDGMVFRCNLDGSEFETLGWNFRNNWEVCVDSFGTLWQSDNDDDGNRGVRINFVMEFGNYGYRDELTGAGWRDPRSGMHEEIPLRHWHQNDPGSIPNLLQTGAGSPTGICVYEGDLLPEVFHNEMIHCDAGPNIVRAYPVETDGAGYTAEIVDVLHGARDNWFRPSDVCVAPDGSLFVADWYDPGVGGHRMADVERGRIFRLAPKTGNYKVAPVDLSTPKLAVAALQSPNMATRYLAWKALQEFGSKSEPMLAKLFKEGEPRQQARALWALGKLPIDANRKVNYLEEALLNSNADIRITAIRLARQLIGEIELADVQDVLNLSDESPAVRRELLIGLRDLEIPGEEEYWAELALRYTGDDRWYLEALGIAAHGNWDACLNAWLNRVGTHWNTPAGRDIIWRSRATKTPHFLAQIVLSSETPAEELPRYFRALDFNKPYDQLQLARLAFQNGLEEAARADVVSSEALDRLGDLNLDEHPEYAEALAGLLASKQNTGTFVALVKRFQLADRYPELIEMAINNSEDQFGVDALRALLEVKQQSLIRAELLKRKPEEAIKLASVIGLSEENAALGPLFGVITDSSANLDVRRAAVRAAGRTRPGLVRLAELAKEEKIDSSLVPTVAPTLHSAVYRDIKDTAQKLYPLPPAKDAEPIPPLSELAKKKGDEKKGRLVFHTHGTCSKCHQVNGLGKEVGPDLSEIGKKLSRQAMYESILYPSAGISHNYEAYTVITADGNILNGLMVSESEDELSIKNAEGIVKTISRDDVDDLVKQKISLMPADLQKVMTTQELIDVVEYMTTLQEKKK
ncbi:MAG: PVC-type heme-binding CxxCH protein [Rubinisphaera brasiliensis]|uniref:PVC-type heme-binding CxxCH protein n=1 Tax=Rubinisphaera brasiliensis TaxID=119 RepID=UPI00391C85C8